MKSLLQPAEPTLSTLRSLSSQPDLPYAELWALMAESSTLRQRAKELHRRTRSSWRPVWDQIQITPAQLATRPRLAPATPPAASLGVWPQLLVQLGWSESEVESVNPEILFDAEPGAVRVRLEQGIEGLLAAVRRAPPWVLLDANSDQDGTAALELLLHGRRELGTKRDRRTRLCLAGATWRPADFIKALCLGADRLLLGSEVLLVIQGLPRRAAALNHFAANAMRLIELMAAACGHGSALEFELQDVTSFDARWSALLGRQS